MSGSPPIRIAAVVTATLALALTILAHAPDVAVGGPNPPCVQAHQGEVTRLALVPGTEFVLSTGADGRATLWTYPELKRMRDVLDADSGLLSLAVSRDGRRFAAGDARGNLWLVYLWGDEARQPPIKQTVPQDAALDMLSSGDDTRFFSLMLSPSQTNPSVRSWNGLTLAPDSWFQGAAVPSLWSMSADVNTTLVAAASDVGNIVRWKTPQSLPARYAQQTARFTCTATAPDGKTCFFGDDSGGLWVISEARKEPMRVWSANQPIASLAVDDAGQFIAIGLGRPTRKAIYRRTALKQPYAAPSGAQLPIWVMKTATFAQGPGTGMPSEKDAFSIPGAVGGTLCMAFSKSGKHLVYGGADGTLRVWLISDGRSRISTSL